MNQFYHAKVVELFLQIPQIQKAFSYNAVVNMIVCPPRPELGDLSCSCFQFAAVLGKSPQESAQDLVEDLCCGEDFAEIRACGPYINFFLHRLRFVNKTLDMLGYWVLAGKKTSHAPPKNRKSLVIDFSSPNIAKPFSISHLRSTSLGNSLARIFEYLGYEVVRINHLGDWGTSFGKLIYAYKHWGHELDFQSRPLHKLLDLYVRFQKEAEENPQLEAAAKESFRKLEAGDPDSKALWQRFRDLSLQEFQRIYTLLDVTFDHYTGESFYQEKVPQVLKELHTKALTKTSQSALIIDFAAFPKALHSDDPKTEALPPLLLQKDDGSSLYATRDLAAAIYRFEEFHFDRMIYVVGAEQNLYFQQIFQTLQHLGKDWAIRCEHIAFGLIQFKEKKMSTRQGTVIFLEDVITRITQIALSRLQERATHSGSTNISPEALKKTAQDLAISSVIFADLKTTRQRNVTFDWEEMLNPKGETGVYLQYTHARLSSIIERFTKEYNPDPYALLTEDCPITETQSFPLTKILSKFQDTVIQAKESLEPSLIARYLLELAQEFSLYYQNYQILDKANPQISRERMKLILVIREVMAEGLYLLGIRAMQRI